MAGVTGLRDAARAAMLSAGGRGFVRFLSQGDALLVCDAPRRCDDLARLVRAFEDAGFSCRLEEGLALLTPGDALMNRLCGAQPARIDVDFARGDAEIAALCARWLSKPPLEPDDAGRRLILDTARLLWQPADNVMGGMPALRAQAAIIQRRGGCAGLHQAGRLLCGWLLALSHT